MSIATAIRSLLFSRTQWHGTLPIRDESRREQIIRATQRLLDACWARPRRFHPRPLCTCTAGNHPSLTADQIKFMRDWIDTGYRKWVTRHGCGCSDAHQHAQRVRRTGIHVFELDAVL